MSCSRGKASPNEVTKLRLFAHSAGFCQRPDCTRPLFVDLGDKQIHVAEMAHIFAATDHGPRANAELSQEERGQFENLILLCPTCHTTIDKAPSVFSDAIVAEWKRRHSTILANIFGVATYGDRAALRAAIDPVLAENREIFEQYGPDNDYRLNPESEVALVWQRKVRSKILPNNRKLLSVLDANRSLLHRDEQKVLELFRQHVDDLEARHLGAAIAATAARFPSQMNTLLAENGER